MFVLQALLMGVVQGLTEFLPVSSSAHIVLTSHMYRFFTGQELATVGTNEIFFDIIIHLGTLFAVMIYLRKEIYLIFKKFVHALKNRDFSSSEAKLPIFILLGTFVTCCIVLPLRSVVEGLTSEPSIIGCLLIVTGFILFLSEYISSKYSAKTNKITLKSAIVMGLVQGLAIFPGISRSGSTIAAGMMCGVDKVSTAKYSFLLSIPIIVGASLFFPILELESFSVVNLSLPILLTGFLSSMIVGFLCIKYFMKFLEKCSMKFFAYYCWVVGGCMFLLFGFFIK